MAFDIVGRLRLNGTEFANGFDAQLNGVTRKISAAGERWKANLGANLRGGLAGAVAGLAAGISIDNLRQSAQQGLDYASSLGEVAQQLGVTVEALQEYRFAATQTGISQEKMDSSLARLTRTLAESPDKFARLGISVRDANGQIRDAGEVIPDIARALQGMSAAEQAAAAVDIFGKSGQQLIPLLSEGAEAIENYRQRAQDLGIVLTAETIVAADEAADKMAELNKITEAQNAKVWAENAEQLYKVSAAWEGLKVVTVNAGASVLEFFSERLPAGMDRTNDAMIRAFGTAEYAAAAIDRINRRFQASAQQSIVGVANAVIGITGAPRAAAGARRAPPRAPIDFDDASPRIGGAARSGGGGRSARPDRGESEAQRQAKQLAEERIRNQERLNDFVRDGLVLASDTAQLEEIRVTKGREAADLARVRLDFERQHPGVLAQSVEEFARLEQLAAPQNEADRERLRTLQAQLVALRDQNVENARTGQLNAQNERRVAKLKEAERAAAQEAAENADREREKIKRRTEENFQSLANFYEDIFSGRAGNIWKDFKAQGIAVLAELAAQFTLSRLTGGSGGLTGGLFGQSGGQGGLFGALGGLFGGGKSSGGGKGGGIGGLLKKATGGLGGLTGKGGEAGAAAGEAAGEAGGASPYVAAALVAFTVLSTVLKKTKKGSAALSFSGGDLGLGATAGNSKSRIAAASSGISSLANQLESIADQLGGTITGAGSVSLGVRNKKYVVDTTGKNRTKGAGVLKFENEQEAIRAALLDALQDGVIGAISEASRRILASGKDLDKSLQKAALIEAIPKALKARTDPVGAALDELNQRWDKTIAALREGGASAEQMADAQRLYRLELDETRESAGQVGGVLRDFLDSLKFGSASPLSLRDQQAAAEAALSPFLQKIDSGQSIDQQAYQQAASTFLDIQRQIEASGPGFFSAFDQIKNYTSRAIASVENATSLPARDPFAQANANAAQSTATATQSTAEILAQQSNQLANIEKYLNTLAGQAVSGAVGGGFIGADRGFAARSVA